MRRLIVPVLAAFAAFAALAQRASAQSATAPISLGSMPGGLGDYTRFYVLSGTQNGAPHLQAIILWRGTPGWNQPTQEEIHRGDSLWRAERYRDHTDGKVFGTYQAHGLVEENHSVVTVEGRRFELDPADSALAILVTIVPNGLPRIVTSAKIAQFPSGYWEKQWTSGDTLITVRPKFADQLQMIFDTVNRTATGAAFFR